MDKSTGNSERQRVLICLPNALKRGSKLVPLPRTGAWGKRCNVQPPQPSNGFGCGTQWVPHGDKKRPEALRSQPHRDGGAYLPLRLPVGASVAAGAGASAFTLMNCNTMLSLSFGALMRTFIPFFLA